MTNLSVTAPIDTASADSEADRIADDIAWERHAFITPDEEAVLPALCEAFGFAGPLTATVDYPEDGGTLVSLRGDGPVAVDFDRDPAGWWAEFRIADAVIARTWGGTLATAGAHLAADVRAAIVGPLDALVAATPDEPAV